MKNLTKLTAVVLVMGVLLVSGLVACGRPVEQEREGEFDEWNVNWNGYRPIVKPPQIDEEQLPEGNLPSDEEQDPPQTTPDITTPVTKPVTYTTMIKSNADSLNVRTAPSTGGRVLGTLDKDDMVRYEGLQNGWYKTVYKQTTAYVYAKHASLVYMKQGSQQVESVIAVGEELLGYPYVWGSQRYHWGNGVLNTNFVQGQYDCSALIQYMFYKGAGVLMDLNTRSQVLQGKKVDASDLQRGDVMFFTNDSRVGNTGVERVGHVALYLGDNYILHTASDHAVIEQLTTKRWNYFLVAKRFV